MSASIVRRVFTSPSKFWLALLFLIPAGCGGEKLYPVEGTISVDGTPLAKGAVVFWSEKPSADQPAGDVENGKFTIMTKGKTGAPEGTYKVTVSGNEEIDSTKPFKTKMIIPAAYREQAKTPLTVQVSPSSTPKSVEFAVKSK
ncbi:MAG: hypothetical protein U0744_05400 [Gemmataceae bacterium]